jgi:hypothetical protein
MPTKALLVCTGTRWFLVYPRLACVEHHRLRGRVHRLHGPRLGGNLGYRRVGRSVGSIGDIVGHADIGWTGPVCLCQNVEVQARQVLEDLEPTTMKFTCDETIPTARSMKRSGNV